MRPSLLLRQDHGFRYVPALLLPLGSAIFSVLLLLNTAAQAASRSPLAWPAINREARPWAYWWWMGSAVDKTNLTRELTRYRDGGYGGVHIIPIYGAKGWETNYIPYLSPKWMEMLGHTVSEARRLDLGVDMTTGTGWCFGGPATSDEQANASVIVKTVTVTADGKLEKFDPKTTQALVAFSNDGRIVELTDKIRPEGEVNWMAFGGEWTIYSISQRPSGQKVKRAAPGGQGHMLNMIYPPAVNRFLDPFWKAFADYRGPKPRAQYHDSYEYRSEWSPDFFARFEKRRGYRLQMELPAFLDREQNDRAARVRADYRETVSDVMIEESLPLWVNWSRRHGFLTRNEAHGSPGNLLDLYALADVPETEMFRLDRNKLISKFASSAAHVAGRKLVSCETGTWLKEHFSETLADMKYLLDDLFVSGVNHVFYHGTCYSPDEAPWPGWLFYASYEMNPRNSVWRDAPALNAYVARCQAILQSGTPDNDILLYWPIHDFWHNAPANPRLPHLTVHARGWLEGQPIGRAAVELWDRGFTFDYVSDRQLASAKLSRGKIRVPGGDYRVVVVPACTNLPLATLEKLLALAQAGGTIIFENQLPQDVPGWGDLEQRRASLQKSLGRVKLGKIGNGASNKSSSPPERPLTPSLSPNLVRPSPPSTPLTQRALREGGGLEGGEGDNKRGEGVSRTGEGVVPVEAWVGKGRVIVGELASALAVAQVPREPMVDHEGLHFIRRAFDGGRHYFIANRGEKPVDQWVTLATQAKSVVVMDPSSARTGIGAVRSQRQHGVEVYVQLQPGESVILRTFARQISSGDPWSYERVVGQPVEIAGEWHVKFIQGGPDLPSEFSTTKLSSWTELGGEETQRFAGTAKYSITFDLPSLEFSLQAAPNTLKRELQLYSLDLGKVCQSARVRLNGRDLGTFITPPFRVAVDDLKPRGNLLEVEVTNVSANRIRDLDRRGVKWKNFHDINFVNQDYRPFDASNWPLYDSGLLGPVTLTAMEKWRPLSTP